MTGSLGSDTAASLLVELVELGALDVTHVRNGDDHGVVGIEVLGIELMVEGNDFRTALVAILLLDLLQFLLHDLLAALGIVQYLLQVGNKLHQVIVLLVQLVYAQARQLREAHVNDGLRLQLVQFEALLQVALGIAGRLGVADDVNHLVNVVDGNDQSFQDVGALLSLLQVVLGATDGDVVAVLDEVLDALLQRQEARTPLDQGDVVDGERRLQGRHLEQFIQQHVGVGVALAVHDDAHALTARLVVDVGHALNLVLVGQVGNVLDQVGLVDAVGYLRHHNLVVRLAGLNLGLGTHNDASASRLVGVAHALQTVDVGARGEVGAGNILHQPVGIYIRIVDVGAAAVDDLAQVVRRHVGGHAHGNAVAAVDQQVRNLRRHDAGLDERVVEVVLHVDGVLLKVVHDVLAHLRQAALGVTHGCRRVAVDGAEVALAVNQRVAHVPLLGHAHQGTVDRRVAVGVILTQHLADDARALLVRLCRNVIDAHHAVQDAAVDGLETITHIREGTSHDDGHRIIDVRGLHLLLNVDFHDSVVVKCLIHLFFSDFAFKGIFSPADAFLLFIKPCKITNNRAYCKIN